MTVMAIEGGMQRYFFHIHNSDVVPDLCGTELPSLTAARDHALAEARQLAAQGAAGGHLDLTEWIEVSDQFGKAFFSVEVGDAVRVRPRV